MCRVIRTTHRTAHRATHAHASAGGRTVHRAACLLALALTVACSSDSPDPVATCEVSAITITPSSGELAVGETRNLVGSAEQRNCGSVTMSWQTSHPDIISVSGSGTITALKAGGPVAITATYQGRVGQGTFSVRTPATPVASVLVSPATVSVTVGGTTGLTATVRDAQGNALANRNVVWASENPGVANVSASGTVTGVAAGQARITATSEGVQGSALVTVASPPQNVLLSIANVLIYPVNVSVNGTTIGSIDPQSARQFTVPSLPSMRVAFTLVRPQLGGRPLGDPMSGYWDLTSPTGTVNLRIDNVIGDQWYFAPIVTNTSGVNLLMVVNYTLQAENRCSCVVPTNGVPTNMGYYRLFTNGNVTGFRDGSNYSGPYRYFFNYAHLVLRGSGTLTFYFDIAP